MPRVPQTSPSTGLPTSAHYIHTLSSQFVDAQGRTLLLRGVNLSGSSKAPPNQPSYLRDEMWEAGRSGEMSFVGRPLNVDDGSADVHLARLRGWGFNMLRFPVTWEALEHDGPGKYDYEFMDYTIRVLQKCKEFGFKVFIDPHQDIWSRFSGGSGAPYWTLIACGINPHNFTATQGAILHSEYPLAHSPSPSTLPAMIWSTNYGRLASQTLYTLFFAGRCYAPKCIIDGQNIETYLQSHFINAFGALADRIRETAPGIYDECVIGWDGMNEPAEGFCGWDDLNQVPARQGSTLRKGSAPTPAESLRLGMGQVQTVAHWTFTALGPKQDGTVTIDPKGHKMWLSPEDEDTDETNGLSRKWGWNRDPGWKLGICIWALHGVWDVETGIILQRSYFRTPSWDPERPVVFEVDYWRPHWRRYAARIRASHPEAILFIQPPVFAEPPPMLPLEDEGTDDLKGRCCYAPHYYDGLTLLTRHWNWFNADALGLIRGRYRGTLPAVRIGERAIRKSIQDQLGILKSDSKILGPYPTLIGEIGIPFDMDAKRAYGLSDDKDKEKYVGDYSAQTKALDASLNAADGGNCMSWTVWTYCADSSHVWGDGWNMEDLSLWSEDDVGVGRRKRMMGMGMRSVGGGEVKGRSERGMASSMTLLDIGKGAEAGRDGVKDTEDVVRIVPNGDGGSAVSLGLVSEDSAEMEMSPTGTLNTHLRALVVGGGEDTVPSITVTSSTPLRQSMHIHTPSPLTSSPNPSLGPTPDLSRNSTRNPPSSSWSNPFDFLTDGARAWKAFVRPYPVKTVGEPVKVEFDVKSGEFRCEVRVREGDGCVVRTRTSVARTSEDDEEGGEGEWKEEYCEIATEIYVPLVHYASQAVLAGSVLADGDGEQGVDGRVSSSSSSESLRRMKGSPRIVGDKPRASGSGSRSASPTSIGIDISRSGSFESIVGSGSGADSSLNGVPVSMFAHGVGGMGGIGEENLVDLDVKVSAGRWTVEGQVLKWWYPVPARKTRRVRRGKKKNSSSSSASHGRNASTTSTSTSSSASGSSPAMDEDIEEEEIEFRHTIRIRRAKGPVRLRSDVYSQSQLRLQFGASSATLSREVGRWCEKLCGAEGCVVM